MKSTIELHTGQMVSAHCLNTDVQGTVTDILDDQLAIINVESANPPRDFIGERLIIQAFEIKDPEAWRHYAARNNLT